MNKILYLTYFIFLFVVSSYCDKQTDFIKEKCTAVTGNSTYYEQVLEDIEKSKICLSGSFNKAELAEQFQKLEPLGRTDEIFIELCTRRQTIFNCMAINYKSFIKCLTEDEKKSQNINKNIIENAFEYACASDGVLITQFIKNGGVDCFQQNKNYLINCVEKSFDDYIRQVKTKYSTDFTENNCKDFKNFEDCLSPYLRTCSSSRIVNIFNGLIKIITDELTCDNDFIQTTQPSWLSVTDNFHVEFESTVADVSSQESEYFNYDQYYDGSTVNYDTFSVHEPHLKKKTDHNSSNTILPNLTSLLLLLLIVKIMKELIN